VPFDWEAFNEKIFPQFAQAMLRLDEDAIKEFLKIKGFQVRTEMTMNIMGADMKQWMETDEISKKSAPAGTYSAPEGYTKKDKFDMKDIQRR